VQYSRKTLFSLREKPSRPRLHLLATSLTTGQPFSFGEAGVSWIEKGVVQTLYCDNVPIALAVAASSAFPAYFPPVDVNWRTFTDSNHKADFPLFHELTDGGVYDNLGVKQWRLFRSEMPDWVILSDAQGIFDWAIETRFDLFSRQVRVCDILMNQVTEVGLEFLDVHLKDAGGCRRLPIPITSIVNPTGPLTPEDLSPDTQRKLAGTRTDFDDFSDVAVALQRHGYNAARDRLTPILPSLGSVAISSGQYLPAVEGLSSDPRRLKWQLFSSKDRVSIATSMLIVGWLLLVFLLIWLRELL
jgi:hypothetical protein